MAGQTILLVENEDELLQVLVAALERAFPGHRVVGSPDGAGALDAVDVAVVDHGLEGGQTGLDLLQSLRARFPAMKAVLFTGQATATVEADARIIGASVLWKPVRLQVLIAEVRKLLSA